MLIVGNWKLHFDIDRARRWMSEYRSGAPSQMSGVDVFVCPSFIQVRDLGLVVKEEGLRLSLGAQDVSRFGEGRYTGEVSASQLADYVDLVIVGHSERRNYFGETDEAIVEKVRRCWEFDLKPVVCVSERGQVEALKDLEPFPEKLMVAYEPLGAIGSGNPENPAQAAEFSRQIRSLNPGRLGVLYGGSINSENVGDFLDEEEFEGFLVGTASLEANEFVGVVEHVSRRVNKLQNFKTS